MGNLRTMRQLSEESAFQLPGEKKEVGLEEPPPESEFYYTEARSLISTCYPKDTGGDGGL